MKRLLTLLFFSQATWAAEPPDIKGLRLGMTESDVMQVMPNARCIDPKKEVLGERFCLDSNNTLAGHAARISVTLRSGEVVTISARFKNENGADVRRAALAKFGKPADVRRMESRSKATGITAERTILFWPSGDQMLLLSLIADGATDGWLNLSSRKAREVFEKARDIKDKDL